MNYVQMRVENADSLVLTLTLSLPVCTWRHVTRGGYNSVFDRAVTEAIKRVERISGTAMATINLDGDGREEK